jgi:hypothetical protein
MSGLEGSRIKEFAAEMSDAAGDREVWAFIATYDRNGELSWKAFGFDDGEDIVLGSELVTFGSVND